MVSTVKHLNSTTGGNVPSAMAQGQLAVNLVDKRLFTANLTTIFDAFQNTVSNVAISNASGYMIVGNSTVNSFQNSTSFALTVNSTVRFVIAAPSAADYAAATKVLLANGSFGTVTATASPGGANTNVQFDDSSAMGGSAGFTFDKTTNNVLIANTLTVLNETLNGNLTANSDYISIGNSTVNNVVNSLSMVIGNSTMWSTVNTAALTLPITQGSNNIASPAANCLSYFAKYKSGRIMPVTIGSSGWDTPLQAHFIHNSVYQMLAVGGGSAVPIAIRMVSANTVAFTTRTQSSANTFMSQSRYGHTTGGTAGTLISWRNNVVPPFWRGNAAGLGGFYAVARWGLASKAANGTAFIGFTSSNAAFTVANSTVGVLLSAQTNYIGFGWNTGSANVCALSANSTAANTIDLAGFDCTTGNTNWYESVIFAAPNGANVYYQLTNLTTGALVTGQYNQTNLPTTTTFLTWHFWASNANTAAAQIMDWGGVQIEVNL